MSSLLPLSGPIHWILDWDGTITKRDTLDALVNIAAKCKPDSPVLTQWERVTEAYITDYERTLKIHMPDGELPSTRSDEKALLKVLKEVEQRSIDRVSESGIFSGLTTEDIDHGAARAIGSEEVGLRKGCGNFLQFVQSRVQYQDGNADRISILSVNWSRQFISACLRAAHGDFAQILPARIFANELEGITQGAQTTGRICADKEKCIISSPDKLASLEVLRETTRCQGKPMTTVYVGDSWTDLECLLAADMGICIRDDPITSTQNKLADSLSRIGITCTRLRFVEKRNCVGWVEDFDELKSWLQMTR
jgi:hypothetical protein